MSPPRASVGRPEPGSPEGPPARTPARRSNGKSDARRAQAVHGAFTSLFEAGEPVDGDGVAAGNGGAVADDLRAIANRVRRWREEAGLTLQELARRSGVAGSTIQKVESLQMIPTLGVVLKIARGLDRAPSELVRDGGDDLEVVHLRPDERYSVGDPGVAHMERMVGDLFDPQLEAWRITLAPGRGSGRGVIRFDGEGILLCEAGSLDVRMGDETYRLGAGDVLHYKTTLAHGWRNRGEVEARLLLVGTLPRALRAALHRRMRADAARDGGSDASDDPAVEPVRS